jgi:starch phosphorylase
MSLISEGEDQLVKMGPLGILGSHKINGVAALHSELMKQTIFRDYYEEFPDKFTNKTNGITPRRWLVQCNQGLTKLINDTIGNGWETHLDKLKDLEPHAKKAAFRKKFAKVKKEKKQQLATYIKRVMDETLDTDALFDIQIKRIHEYKRQLMACLHAITLYNRLKADPNYKMAPRVIMFAGNAAS